MLERIHLRSSLSETWVFSKVRCKKFRFCKFNNFFLNIYFMKMHLPCTTTSTVKSHVSMDISDVFDMPNVANMTPWLSLLLVINELLFTAMDFTGVFFSLTYQKYYILSLFYYSILQELECRPWLVDQVCINLHQLNLWLLLCLSVKLIR